MTILPLFGLQYALAFYLFSAYTLIFLDPGSPGCNQTPATF